jgi:hypothetical protein
MQLNTHDLLLLGMLSASLHWIIARSTVMRWFWSRLRGWPAALLACPACSGFWLGIGLGTVGVRPCIYPYRTGEIIGAGVLAVLLTPVVQAVFLWGLERTAIDTTPADEPTPPTPPAP